VKLPTPLNDPSFEAFRKQLGEIAQKKDRAALAKLVVAQGFFWEAEQGDKADRKKSGIDNLAAAIGLGGKEGFGWDLLAGYSGDPTAAPFPGKQGVMCAPADPTFDEKALEELAKSTQNGAIHSPKASRCARPTARRRRFRKSWACISCAFCRMRVPRRRPETRFR
jgi:hypothetical protein